MSNWVHVAGIIRIDDIRFDTDIPVDFDKLIGKAVTWDDLYKRHFWDDIDKNPQKYLPMGSEGSLEKSVWVNSDNSRISAYTVSIFGDLRDYNEPQDIIDWFQNKIAEIENFYPVRQATITVTNGWDITKNWTKT